MSAEVARAITMSPSVERVAVAVTTDLDHLIADEGVFELPLARQVAIRDRVVRETLRIQLDRCAAYAAFADRRRFVPDQLGELGMIPLVPSSVFKAAQVLSVPEAEIAKWCKSSGTEGAQSLVGRDRTTLERLLGSIRAGVSLIHAWLEDDLEVIHLGPDRSESGDIWFMYVMSLIELLYPTRHFVRGGEFDVPGALRRVHELIARSERHVAVVGPPFRVLELIEAIEHAGTRIAAGPGMTVLTAGGWKRFSGKRIEREAFDARARAAFGLDDTSQIRDAFNQVELNTVFIECSAHRKHVPPWVYAAARDPDRLTVLPPGQVGVMSYLDASATSYPGFIISEDVGEVSEGVCACGRTGTTLQVQRRLVTVAQRGCALTLDAGAASQQVRS
jgi:long-chain-fatty-acid---luciferin-component ligase